MTTNDDITAAAVAFVKSHKTELIERFCPPDTCHPSPNPISLFMAGSPGAGKTEVSKGLIKKFEDMPMRIDADEIRAFCPGYVGTNAHLFQEAANKGVNILYDHALGNRINCILDGTFAYADVVQNIERSLKKGRRVEVWFVYQDPKIAWAFTKAREAVESRRVAKDVFIRALFKSRENAKMVKEKFGSDVELNILLKNYATGQEELWLNQQAQDLDHLANDRYSAEELQQQLV
jgi:predicted ABC-type ATPase